MGGINRETGKWLDGFGHVLQSIGVIFTTWLGSRAMRRRFGSNVPTLFGSNLTAPQIGAYRLAISVAIDIWEPRFKIIACVVLRDENSPEALRSGKFCFALRGRYYPRGHLGDKTTFEPTERTLYIGQGVSNGVLVL